MANIEDTVIAHIEPMSRRDFYSVIMSGFATGVAVWVLGFVLNRFIPSAEMSYSIAAIICAVAALAWLIRARIPRPLVIAFGAVLSLWGIMAVLLSYGYTYALLGAGVYYAVAFAVYAWAARLRNFWIMAIVVGLVLMVSRLVLAG